VKKIIVLAIIAGIVLFVAQSGNEVPYVDVQKSAQVCKEAGLDTKVVTKETHTTKLPYPVQVRCIDKAHTTKLPYPVQVRCIDKDGVTYYIDGVRVYNKEQKPIDKE